MLLCKMTINYIYTLFMVKHAVGNNIIKLHNGKYSTNTGSDIYYFYHLIYSSNQSFHIFVSVGFYTHMVDKHIFFFTYTVS